MILDIAGFSKISESLGPERSFEVIKDLFRIVDPLIFDNKGVIDKKLGDGLIAFFGDSEEEKGPQDPLSEKRVPALQAVTAALQIQQKLRFEDSENLKSIKLRIGINSGEALLGNAGSELHFDYTVLGSTVNFTQRLEAACRPGHVLVSESTWQLVQDTGLQANQRSIEVKNDDKHYPAYELASS